MALRFTIERFPEELYMWTFTWAEPTTPKDGAKKWSNFLHGKVKTRQGWESNGFRSCFPHDNGLRVFEMHEGKDRWTRDLSHGLHVHALVTRRLPVDIMRTIWETEGDGGRIHVVKIPRERAVYVGKYLSKQRMECLEGVRLWSAFGPDHEASKVKDIILDTRWSATYRFMAVAIGGWNQLRWDQRARMTTAFCMGDNFDQALRSIGMTPETEDGERRMYDREMQ